MKKEGIKIEKLACAAFGLLAAWSVLSFFINAPGEREVPSPVLADGKLPGNMPAIIELASVDEYLKSGGDVFTYAPLDAIEKKITRPGKKTTRQRTRAVPASARIVNLPPKEVASANDDKSKADKKAGKSKYVFPLDVIGFVKKEGASRNVIVCKKGESSYRRLGVGDEWHDVLVLQITDDTAVFRNEFGKRVKIVKNIFGTSDKDENVEYEYDGDAEDSATALLDKAKGGKNNLHDSLKGVIGKDGKPDLGKAGSLLNKLSPEERKNLLDLGMKMLFE